MRSRGWIVVAAAVLAGCAAAPSVAPPVDGPVALAATSLGGSPEAAARGRDLYTTRCARCHTAPRPDSETADAWERILPRMASKARLDSAQAADVRLYVRSALAAKAGTAR
jgi:mono/diheme cytochrome c family protein